MGDPMSPQPLHNPGSPASPPPRWSVWTNVSKQPQMVPSLPRPPSTASAPSLGAEQQGFGKDKCVPPHCVTINTHDSARGHSRGELQCPGGGRNTGVRGVSVCPFQNLHFPQPQEPAGGSHGGEIHSGRAPPPRPFTAGSSRGAWGAQAVKPRGQSSPAHTCSCRGNIQPQDMAAPETRLLCFPSLLCHRHSWVPLVSAVPVPVSPTPGSLGPALGGTGRRLYCSQKCIVNEL